MAWNPSPISHSGSGFSRGGCRPSFSPSPATWPNPGKSSHFRRVDRWLVRVGGRVNLGVGRVEVKGEGVRGWQCVGVGGCF